MFLYLIKIPKLGVTKVEVSENKKRKINIENKPDLFWISLKLENLNNLKIIIVKKINIIEFSINKIKVIIFFFIEYANMLGSKKNLINICKVLKSFITKDKVSEVFSFWRTLTKSFKSSNVKK